MSKWRPIRSAPKDRTQVLIAAVNGDGDYFVCEARWVDVPHNNELMKSWENGGTRDAQKIPAKAYWRDGRAAILDHGGACTGKTWEARSDIIFHPTHWMPLPNPPTKRKLK